MGCSNVHLSMLRRRRETRLRPGPDTRAVAFARVQRRGAGLQRRGERPVDRDRVRAGQQPRAGEERPCPRPVPVFRGPCPVAGV